MSKEPSPDKRGGLKAALAAWYSPSHHSIEERMQAVLNAAVEPMAPEDVQEWLWHLDLHLTEHDEPHAGRALRAAWPHVRTYLASVENERNTWRELAKNAESTPSHVAQFAPTQGQIDGAMAELEQCFQGSGSKGRDLGRMQSYARMVCHVRHLAVTTPSTIAPSERALTDDEISAAWNGAGADRPEAGAADLYLHYMRAVAKAQRAKMLAFMPSATRPSTDGMLLRLIKWAGVENVNQHPLQQELREFLRRTDGGKQT